MNSISGALQAYQQALGRIGNTDLGGIQDIKKPEFSFQSMVKEAVQETQSAVKHSENMSIQGITGKADIQDVVLAVSNAEVALETLVTVRNSAIQAYKEIMQMNI